MNFVLKPFAFIYDGGPVAVVLVILAFILCYLIGYRYLWLTSLAPKKGVSLYVGSSKIEGTQDFFGSWVHSAQELPTLVNNYQLAVETHASDYRTSLRKNQQSIRSIVIVAPLLGLLGTVIGMIETFDSLQDAALFSQSGGIAGGISQALITTQLGLVVAIPGLLMGRKLDRLQNKISQSIDQVLLTLQLKHQGEV